MTKYALNALLTIQMLSMSTSIFAQDNCTWQIMSYDYGIIELDSLVNYTLVNKKNSRQELGVIKFKSNLSKIIQDCFSEHVPLCNERDVIFVQFTIEFTEEVPRLDIIKIIRSINEKQSDVSSLKGTLMERITNSGFDIFFHYSFYKYYKSDFLFTIGFRASLTTTSNFGE